MFFYIISNNDHNHKSEKAMNKKEFDIFVVYYNEIHFQGINHNLHFVLKNKLLHLY